MYTPTISSAFPLGSHLSPTAFSSAYCRGYRCDITLDLPQTVQLEMSSKLKGTVRPAHSSRQGMYLPVERVCECGALFA